VADFAIYPSLRDRPVLVTGGGSGIGATIVEHFAAQGARVCFLDRIVDASQELAAKIAANGDARPEFICVDLTDITALRAAVTEAARRIGTIRVLVNNAASDDRHQIDSVTPEYWDERMAVNLRHQFFAAQAVHAGMAAVGGGSIINLGSVSWMLKQGGMPAYTTAKSAIVGLTHGLARDFGPARIRVNSVVPGWIMTERQLNRWLTPEAERALLDRQCLKEKLYPPDIARMVLWLAADDARMVTAQQFIVDGGWV
jgi:D-xylose 1-dehydrogenase